MNILMCKLNVLVNIVISLVDECMHGFKFVPKLTIFGVPDA